MNRPHSLVFAASLALITAWIAGGAAAQTPDALSSYRLIPSRSRLQVTGGAAGLNQQFFAYGTFGFAVSDGRASSGAPPTGELPQARFAEVQSWLLPDSSIPFQWDTDFTLRLSKLSGTASPVDPHRYEFSGIDGQNQPMTLTAIERGELLHLVGENEPGSNGSYQYRFDALAYRAPFADFNLDGMVDDIDAHVLMSNIGTIGHATFEQGDADGDGDVDGHDFLVWQREIGAATTMGESADVASSSMAMGAFVVPEPETLALLLAVTIVLTAYLRRSSTGRRPVTISRLS